METKNTDIIIIKDNGYWKMVIINIETKDILGETILGPIEEYTPPIDDKLDLISRIKNKTLKELPNIHPDSKYPPNKECNICFGTGWELSKDNNIVDLVMEQMIDKLKELGYNHENKKLPEHDSSGNKIYYFNNWKAVACNCTLDKNYETTSK